MIQQMINNMLGEYSKFIRIQDDGTIKVFVPEDIKILLWKMLQS